MYELITESINRISELVGEYRQAEAAARAEQEAFAQRTDGSADDPAFRQLKEEKLAALRQSVHNRTVLAVTGRSDMPKRKVVRQIEQTDEYRTLFEEKLAASTEYQAALALQLPSQLFGQDRKRYEDLVSGSFVSESVEKRNHLRNLIRKECRDLIELIDIKGEIAKDRQIITSAMEDALAEYFRTTNTKYYAYEYINNRNFESYVGSFVARSTDTMHFYKAKAILFPEGQKPSEYVLSLVLGSMHKDLRAGVDYLAQVDKALGTSYAGRIRGSLEGKKNIGNAELAEVCERFSRERITRLFSENPTYSGIFESRRARLEKEARVKNGLLDAIPGTYPDLFPLARATFRHFILHIGPTNSGKSYDAIEALKKAESGIYLAPLRLLAYEKYEELNEAGCWCSLKTGEEEVMVPRASVQSSTIEMLDFLKQYDVAVIDEAQMIADPQRGSSWTMALLGVQARTVHVCLAPEAEEAVKSIIRACDDTFEIVRHKRFVPLRYEEESPIVFPKKVERGTAFIVFSRRDVHAVAGELQRNGYRCSVIYGALPYDVRRNEVKRYMAHDTDIVVATDAIGMGLNLPIKRIVFLKTSKFDGTELRDLNYSEIKQISGRAGRYGMFDEGLVSTEDDERLVRKALTARLPQIKEARIGFPFSLIGIEGTVSQLMRKWCEIEAKPGFEVADLTREIGLAEELERETGDKTLVYRFVMFPFDDNNRDLKDVWYKLFRTEKKGKARNFMSLLPPEPKETDSLEDLEQAFKLCDLLYHSADAFVGKDTGELYTIAKKKNRISEVIMEKLSKEKLRMRTCKVCGRPLPFTHKRDICQRCMARQNTTQ